MVNGDNLCGHCRDPLSEEAQKEHDETMAGCRGTWSSIGGAPTAMHTRDRDNEVGFLPEEHRLRDDRHSTTLSSDAIQGQYRERIAECREGSRAGSGMRHVASIPAEDYWGRMKATGDDHYWDNKDNLNKHKDYLVDEG